MIDIKSYTSIRIEGGMMVKAKVTLSIDSKKWTDFRIKCLREKKIASEVIEQCIEEQLKKK